VLASAERVHQLCAESYGVLYEREEAVLSQLGVVWKRVAELAAIDPKFATYLDLRDGIKSQLEDLAFFLRGYAAGVDASPDRLAQVEDRLAALERLKRKHGPTLDEVIDRGRILARERALLAEGADEGRNLGRELEEASAAYLAAARDLSYRRRAAAVEFAKRVEGLLTELAMDRARFEVRFEEGEAPPERWGTGGIDRAEFFVSPNPGEELRPLVRVASGGELSRLMLALQTLEARDAPGKTLIFDEVDAGIGGRVAGIVGARLGDLGSRFQVLCITHLPQIAAQGTSHFRIEKSIRRGRTVTGVERLEGDDRIQEVARMIGGAAVTATVLASAEELLAGAGERRKAKAKAKVQWPRSI